ncbi:MAG: hypothetical protein QM607_04810, partial [Microbacterium sp.]
DATVRDPEGRVVYAYTLPPTHAWSRICSDCDGLTWSEAVKAILPDADPTADEIYRLNTRAIPLARFVFERAKTDEIEKATGKPWRHVTEAHRQALKDALAAIYAQTRPSASQAGGCGFCGIDTSVGWVEAPRALREAAGRRAEVCSACAAHLSIRLGHDRERWSAASLNRLRALGAELATGYANGPGWECDDFRLAAEVTSDPQSTVWAYSPRLADWIDETWTRSPSLAPDELRDEYERKRDERIAQQRAAEEQEAALTAW